MSSYFLNIDGIKGESQAKNHKGEIELTSVTWGKTNSGGQPGSGGADSGKTTFQDLQFVAVANKVGPQLMLHCATGKRISRATPTGSRANGAERRRSP